MQPSSTPNRSRPQTAVASVPVGRSLVAMIALVMGAASSAVAQRSPYTEAADRPIKALSAEQIESYLAGDGMGFAMAAELNHYPGPRHALELADSLGLTDPQRDRITALFATMQAEAQRLGREIVSAEATLDSLFSGAVADSGSVEDQVGRIARLTGKVRTNHLQAHLVMKQILTPHQVMEYDRLRGYGTGAAHHHE